MIWSLLTADSEDLAPCPTSSHPHAQKAVISRFWQVSSRYLYIPTFPWLSKPAVNPVQTYLVFWAHGVRGLMHSCYLGLSPYPHLGITFSYYLLQRPHVLDSVSLFSVPLLGRSRVPLPWQMKFSRFCLPGVTQQVDGRVRIQTQTQVAREHILTLTTMYTMLIVCKLCE